MGMQIRIASSCRNVSGAAIVVCDVALREGYTKRRYEA